MKLHFFSIVLLLSQVSDGLAFVWRQSNALVSNGFLTDVYTVEGLPITMRVRQVPGDGNCLFHSIIACLEYACNTTHPSLNLNELMPKSAALRQMAVDYLVEDPDRVLYLEDGESVPVGELLAVVASQYNMTVENYCSHMRLPAVWGGGPEIVALSNCLQRPIHVYELGCAGRRFCLRRMACFGSPDFDGLQPLHILSADARFPNLKPGKQLLNGNHFLALFPENGKESEGESGDCIRGGESASRGSWFGVKTLNDLLSCCCLPPCPWWGKSAKKQEDVSNSATSDDVVESTSAVEDKDIIQSVEEMIEIDKDSKEAPAA